MFKRIRLCNFRTHVDTEIELGPVTLLMGSNNSGKSNLLAGIRHFSTLVALGRPRKGPMRLPGAREYHSPRHRLASADAPMVFSCAWSHERGDVEYEITLRTEQGTGDREEERLVCSEKLELRCPSDSPETKAWDSDGDRYAALQRTLEGKDLEPDERKVIDRFFRDLGSCYIFDLQASFLRGSVPRDGPQVDADKLSIAAQLGREGGNLQELLGVALRKDPRIIERFLASLRRFEPSFHGVQPLRKGKSVSWSFDLGRVPARADKFPPDVVSDGLLRAAAIALLSSMRSPPALILFEEIENGISQRNLDHFFCWLRQAAGKRDSSPRGYNTQFLLTSHSPSVLREYSDRLDEVYHVRLERRGYRSVASNLNSSLSGFVDLGTVEGEFREKDGKRVVHVAPSDLVELWYSGVIGGQP